jgi:hypothetical protein
MAKVSERAKSRYQERVKEYRTAVLASLATEKQIGSQLEKGNHEQTDKRLMLTQKNLGIVSYYVLMNELSVSLLGIKNEALLNDARKCCYKALIYLEDIVSTYIDSPFSEYEDGVFAMDAVLGDKEKLDLLRKVGFALASVREGFGENTKWKWSFVELDSRLAVAAKNMLNLKTVVGKLDPNHRSYDAVLDHIDLVRRLLQSSADDYRQKYELTTRRPDDMQMAINLLAALRRVQMLLGEVEDAENVKKKVDVWRTKLEMDIKGKKRERPQAKPR